MARSQKSKRVVRIYTAKTVETPKKTAHADPLHVFRELAKLPPADITEEDHTGIPRLIQRGRRQFIWAKKKLYATREVVFDYWSDDDVVFGHFHKTRLDEVTFTGDALTGIVQPTQYEQHEGPNTGVHFMLVDLARFPARPQCDVQPEALLIWESYGLAEGPPALRSHLISRFPRDLAAEFYPVADSKAWERLQQESGLVRIEARVPTQKLEPNQLDILSGLLGGVSNEKEFTIQAKASRGAALVLQQLKGLRDTVLESAAEDEHPIDVLVKYSGPGQQMRSMLNTMIETYGVEIRYSDQATRRANAQAAYGALANAYNALRETVGLAVGRELEPISPPPATDQGAASSGVGDEAADAEAADHEGREAGAEA